MVWCVSVKPFSPTRSSTLISETHFVSGQMIFRNDENAVDEKMPEIPKMGQGEIKERH